MIRKALLLTFLIVFTVSCGGIDGERYRQMQPGFDLKTYFDGTIKVWGMVQDYSGNVVSRFTADIDASWEGNKGVLDERFVYLDSGEEQVRIWHITQTGETTYTGTAGDIIGTAEGRAYGNALYWTYEMDVPVDGSTYRLRFDDWIWAMDDEVIINRSYLKKFGITVAEVTIFMQKQP